MRRVTLAECMKAVIDRFDVSKTKLLSDSHEAKYAVPRLILMMMAREFTGMSTPAIGRALNRDHSTVIYATKSIQRRIYNGNTVIDDHVRAIRQKIQLYAQAGGWSVGDMPSPDGFRPARISWHVRLPIVAVKSLPPAPPISHKYL